MPSEASQKHGRHNQALIKITICRVHRRHLHHQAACHDSTRAEGAGQVPHTPLQTTSSSSGPPQPPSNGVKTMAGRATSKTPVALEQFDLTLDDDMDDAGDATAKVLADQEQANLEGKITIAQQIANNLGPHFLTADQSYVARLTELGTQARRRRGSKTPMEVSTDSQAPPPPPGQRPTRPTLGRRRNSNKIDTNLKTTERRTDAGKV